MAVRAKKRFGQHWLRDEQILNHIVAAAAVSEGDRILEIGPGTGLLTRRLVPYAKQVIAVEIDRNLCRKLRDEFKGCSHFHLIEGDYLSLDLEQAFAAQCADPIGPLGQTASPVQPMPSSVLPEWTPPNKVVANIPYYITGPILENLLGRISQPNPHPFESIVLLVQKEVGDRICATAGTKAFGALSVRVQYLADCELVCPVPAKAFSPPPKIDSAVVKLKPRPFVPPAHHPKRLETLVKVGFATKRKMLRNNLKSLVDRDRLTTLLETLGINPQARPEELDVQQWVALSDK
ncbi:MAG: 16S rRNA (adenine(1518)-N(6)/adenine(1519)-N(6))-dimethyltransferase RsmA, partial [Merismopedia sp. SIO2A8]|nr:16S rRNA (adenine(1518)-N(6)/adenine(1519)-N(6))-dimethyltransferase RsmA [Merismopedia sp. SIO2A8]